VSFTALEERPFALPLAIQMRGGKAWPFVVSGMGVTATLELCSSPSAPMPKSARQYSHGPDGPLVDMPLLDMGLVSVSETQHKTVYLRNTGSQPSQFSILDTVNPNFIVSPLSGTVYPQAAVPITIGYLPTDTGVHDYVLRILSDSGAWSTTGAKPSKPAAGKGAAVDKARVVEVSSETADAAPKAQDGDGESAGTESSRPSSSSSSSSASASASVRPRTTPLSADASITTMSAPLCLAVRGQAGQGKLRLWTSAPDAQVSNVLALGPVSIGVAVETYLCAYNAGDVAITVNIEKKGANFAVGRACALKVIPEGPMRGQMSKLMSSLDLGSVSTKRMTAASQGSEEGPTRGAVGYAEDDDDAKLSNFFSSRTRSVETSTKDRDLLLGAPADEWLWQAGKADVATARQKLLPEISVEELHHSLDAPPIRATIPPRSVLPLFARLLVTGAREYACPLKVSSDRETVEVTVTAVGGLAHLTCDAAAPLALGAVATGTLQTRTVTVRNTGLEPCAFTLHWVFDRPLHWYTPVRANIRHSRPAAKSKALTSPATSPAASAQTAPASPHPPLDPLSESDDDQSLSDTSDEDPAHTRAAARAHTRPDGTEVMALRLAKPTRPDAETLARRQKRQQRRDRILARITARLALDRAEEKRAEEANAKAEQARRLLSDQPAPPAALTVPATPSAAQPLAPSPFAANMDVSAAASAAVHVHAATVFFPMPVTQAAPQRHPRALVPVSKPVSLAAVRWRAAGRAVMGLLQLCKDTYPSLHASLFSSAPGAAADRAPAQASSVGQTAAVLQDRLSSLGMVLSDSLRKAGVALGQQGTVHCVLQTLVDIAVERGVAEQIGVLTPGSDKHSIVDLMARYAPAVRPQLRATPALAVIPGQGELDITVHAHLVQPGSFFALLMVKPLVPGVARLLIPLSSRTSEVSVELDDEVMLFHAPGFASVASRTQAVPAHQQQRLPEGLTLQSPSVPAVTAPANGLALFRPPQAQPKLSVRLTTLLSLSCTRTLTNTGQAPLHFTTDTIPSVSVVPAHGVIPPGETLTLTCSLVTRLPHALRTDADAQQQQAQALRPPQRRKHVALVASRGLTGHELVVVPGEVTITLAQSRTLALVPVLVGDDYAPLYEQVTRDNHAAHAAHAPVSDAIAVPSPSPRAPAPAPSAASRTARLRAVHGSPRPVAAASPHGSRLTPAMPSSFTPSVSPMPWSPAADSHEEGIDDAEDTCGIEPVVVHAVNRPHGYSQRHRGVKNLSQ
jgi:hypothetical protein